MPDSSDRMRVVVYYAIWATLCAAVAGTVVALVHTSFFAFNPGRSAAMQNLFQGIVTALAIAAGQGAVALVTGSLLARFDRSLNLTVLLGLVIGVFDFVMYFLQMAVPRTELGWKPDIAILVVATVAITLLGARAPAATP
ncbi:MAG TPA: hypothetical protein VKC15_18500 [Gemmatimonadales bacterium]|nr:hypothetical protein [Gemmatimonadales bacterium]